jgi:hypothetical protein
MNNTVPKAELLERERRWSRAAGIAALLGAALYIASIAFQQSATGGADSTAEELTGIHDHAASVLIGSVLQGLSYIAFIAPLLFLFAAAEGRSELVRRPFAAIAMLGALLLLAAGIVRGIGITDVADRFAEELPALERQDALEQRQAEQPQPSGARGGEGAGAPAGEQPPAEGESTTTTTGTSNTTGTETTTDGDDSGDEDEAPQERRADDLIEDSGAVAVGSYLTLPGLLGFVAGLVYIPLWAMRTGLLTRFWATLGMALGVSLILLPFATLGLVLWFAVIGLMVLGLWPGPRPPAWEVGEAVPWLKPGEPPAGDDGIEGSGREVAERPLPEPGEGDGPARETQGQPRKKRKRRGGG